MVVDVGTGGLVAFLSLIGISDPGPWGTEWPLMVLVGISGVLGLWLVMTGVLMIALRRTKCWTIGVCTHAVAGCGFFVLIFAMRNDAQHTLANHPGHMAMEADYASGLISVLFAILGIVWLIAAALILAFRIGESRSHPKETREK